MLLACCYSTRAQLIRVDPESGELKWDQAVGRDSFENEVCLLALSAHSMALDRSMHQPS
jgi:hypothetical protein